MKDGLGIHPVAGTDNLHRKLDLLFIHGLGGGAFSTWQYEDKAEYLWPKGLFGDFPDIGVWTIAYGAAPSKWVDDVMSMEDRAENLLNHFVANGIGKRPFALVAHSMGGLIAKYMLTQAECSNDSDYNEIATNCRGVVFLAVPHNGSGWSNLLDYARVLVRGNKILTQLSKDDSALMQLSKNFRQFSQRKKLACYAFIETKEVRVRPKVLGFISMPIPKGIKIVSQSSAGDTELVKPPVPMDDDHFSICKLTSKNDLLYKSMQKIIQAYLDKKPDEPEEISNHIPWFYYTIDHDFLSSYCFIDHFKENDFFVGFFAAEPEHKPYSFAAHCYTIINNSPMREDIRGKMLPIQLFSTERDSFREALHRQAIPDRSSVDPDQQIESWLREEKTLVLYAPIKFENKAARIIEGAIEYLQQLTIQNVRLAVLFSGKEHPEQLPKGCKDMNTLGALKVGDIQDWLDDCYERQNIDFTSKKGLEQELSELLKVPETTYKQTFSVLENYHYSVNR